MEIALLSKKSLRLKGKKSTLVVDVLDTKKTEANAFLFLTENSLESNADKEALTISGPGDYEVSGTKIAVAPGVDSVYEMVIDGIKIVLAKASALLHIKDKIDEQNIVIVYANETIDQSALTNAAPSVVVCYGEKAEEISRQLGKGRRSSEEESKNEGENNDAVIKSVDKFSVILEKLPAELQVVLLA